MELFKTVFGLMQLECKRERNVAFTRELQNCDKTEEETKLTKDQYINIYVKKYIRYIHIHIYYVK